MKAPLVLVACCCRATAALQSAPPLTDGAVRVTTPAQWHRQRRIAILKQHPEVARLIGQDSRTLPLLALSNAAQLAAACTAASLPTELLVPLATLVGGTLSLYQFALLHDVKHGTATLPKGVAVNDALFFGSLPSVFGYFL